jgi:hypothetical protein
MLSVRAGAKITRTSGNDEACQRQHLSSVDCSSFALLTCKCTVETECKSLSYISPSPTVSNRQDIGTKQHVWPVNETNDPVVSLRKKRVAASLGLMLPGKAVTIQAPFLFKHLVDACAACLYQYHHDGLY